MQCRFSHNTGSTCCLLEYKLQAPLAIPLPFLLPLKQPYLGPVPFVVPTQHRQCSIAQGNHAVFRAFTSPHPQHFAIAIDVAQLQGQQLAPPQSTCVNQTQHGAVFFIHRQVQQKLHLILAQDKRQTVRSTRTFNRIRRELTSFYSLEKSFKAFTTWFWYEREYPLATM